MGPLEKTFLTKFYNPLLLKMEALHGVVVQEAWPTF